MARSSTLTWQSGSRFEQESSNLHGRLGCHACHEHLGVGPRGTRLSAPHGSASQSAPAAQRSVPSCSQALLRQAFETKPEARCNFHSSHRPDLCGFTVSLPESCDALCVFEQLHVSSICACAWKEDTSAWRRWTRLSSYKESL